MIQGITSHEEKPICFSNRAILHIGDTKADFNSIAVPYNNVTIENSAEVFRRISNHEEEPINFFGRTNLFIEDIKADFNSIAVPYNNVKVWDSAKMLKMINHQYEKSVHFSNEFYSPIGRATVSDELILFQENVFLQELPFHCWYFDHALGEDQETLGKQLKARAFALGAFCEGVIRVLIESVAYLFQKIIENWFPNEEGREEERVSLSKRETIIQEQKKGVFLSAKAILSPAWAKESGEEEGVGVLTAEWNFGTRYSGDRSNAFWRFEASHYAMPRES